MWTGTPCYALLRLTGQANYNRWQKDLRGLAELIRAWESYEGEDFFPLRVDVNFHIGSLCYCGK